MKILLVNAAGYGNIGDDTYSIVFQKYFSEHELFFMNSDIEPIPEGLDLIVFGGGGLIFDKPGEAHLSYMERYMKHAVERNIKYGFVSVGIQCRAKNNKWDYRTYAGNWVKWFKLAAFASFRDEGSLDYFKKETKRKDFILAPDFCYLFKKHKEYNKKDYLLVIPGARIKTTNKTVEEFISRNKKVIFMNMGGKGTDGPTLEFKKKYPKSIVYLSDDLYPSLAFKLISEAKEVISGRYHGLIFSRISKTKYWVNDPSQYKIQVENKNSNILDAKKHVYMLRKYIK